MVLKVSLNTGINRIRLEFKENHRGYHFGMDSVLIESDWNLKQIVINIAEIINEVLIESDWNLKIDLQSSNVGQNTVLIESDWNLKENWRE